MIDLPCRRGGRAASIRGLGRTWSPTDRCRCTPACAGTTSPARPRWSRSQRSSWRGRTCEPASPCCHRRRRCPSRRRRRSRQSSGRRPCRRRGRRAPGRRRRAPARRRHRPRARVRHVRVRPRARANSARSAVWHRGRSASHRRVHRRGRRVQRHPDALRHSPSRRVRCPRAPGQGPARPSFARSSGEPSLGPGVGRVVGRRRYDYGRVRWDQCRGRYRPERTAAMRERSVGRAQGAQ